jgi:anti-sigma B factor antagonist
MDLLRVSVVCTESSGAPYTLVALAGELDATNNQQLRDMVEAEIAALPHRLILDLSELEFIDSSALKVLLHGHRALAGQGGALGLVQPRGAVARVLALTRADQLVPVFSSVEQAAAGLGG